MIVKPVMGYTMSWNQLPKMVLIRPRWFGREERWTWLCCLKYDAGGEETDVKVCGGVVESHKPTVEAVFLHPRSAMPTSPLLTFPTISAIIAIAIVPTYPISTTRDPPAV